MKFAIVVCVFLSALCSSVESDEASAKVVCYYNGNSFLKEGVAQVSLADIDPALFFCTHLLYGHAGLDGTTNKLVSLNESLDLDTGKGQFRLVTSLKTKYPNLKVMLSVGSDTENKDKYLTVLESGSARTTFIDSAIAILKTYNFDGLNLAWQFPVAKPKKVRSAIGSFFHKLKKTFSDDVVIDEKAEEHREEFTALIEKFRNSFGKNALLLSITMLPNVNASIYVDVPTVMSFLDFVILSPFDLQTSDRNPKEADYPAPIQALNERNPESNMDAQVKYWTSNKAPALKIVVGIPAFGDAWKMTGDSGITGVPPLTVEGPAAQGLQTATPGLLSYPEICVLLPKASNAKLTGADAPLTKVGDPTKKFGTYAYRLPDSEGNNGMWVGYEDPETAALKAAYVKTNSLGGIAIFDLEYDDVRGTCEKEKYPILRAAKYRLTN